MDEIEVRTPSTNGLEALETKTVVDPRSVERLSMKTDERPAVLDFATHRVEEIGFEMRSRKKVLTHDERAVDVTTDADEEHPHARTPVERGRFGIDESPRVERDVVEARISGCRRRPCGEAVDRIQRSIAVACMNRHASRQHPRWPFALEPGHGRCSRFGDGCCDGDGGTRRRPTRRCHPSVGRDAQSPESV